MLTAAFGLWHRWDSCEICRFNFIHGSGVTESFARNPNQSESVKHYVPSQMKF